VRAWAEEEVSTATAVVNQLGLAMENANAQRATIDAMVRLEQVNQMKSDFMKTVSHELRTPLTVVSGYVELMRDGSLGTVPPEWEQPLGLVRTKMNELNRLVQLMLEAARAEGQSLAINLEEIDLVDLVSMAVEAEASDVARHGRELRFDLPNVPMPIRVDRSKLLVVLRNLIENAVKYSPDGEPVDMGVAMNDDTATVWVADRGIGVPEPEKGRIFDQFYRVDRPEMRAIGGTGLGLFIVRNLMELQGGRVRVDDRSGGGSVFSLVVPRRPVLVPGTRTIEPVVADASPEPVATGMRQSG
jgi:signal transduction histidine kinase